MKYFLTLLVCSLVSAAQAAATGVAALAPTPTPQPEEFELKVRFQTPVTGDHELRTRVTVGRPFMQKRLLPERGYIAATGFLQPLKDGTYSLLWADIDWKSDRDNMAGISQLTLTPNKPYGWGIVSSIVHLYTVRISRVSDGHSGSDHPFTPEVLFGHESGRCTLPPDLGTVWFEPRSISGLLLVTRLKARVRLQ